MKTPRQTAFSMNSNPVSRRRFLQTASLLTAAVMSGPVFAAGGAQRRKYDVCIYGATSGGVIAAAALARLGRSVLLIEPTRHVGGMTAGGLGWVDFGRASSIGGATKKYFEAVREFYASENIKTNGWSVEPHVAEMLFEKIMAGQNIEVVREARLNAVKKEGRRIRFITLDKAPVDAHGAPAPQPVEENFLTVEAAIFIDCSYEGDLLAKAGVSHRTDRESRDEFGESLAGIYYAAPTSDRKISGGVSKNPPLSLKIDPYVRPGDAASGLIPLVSDASILLAGSKSPVIQSYNFRLCMAKENFIPIAAPANYDPKNFELIYRYIAALEKVGEPLWAGDLYFNFSHEKRYSAPRLLKITRLLKGKTDVNNAGCISTDYVTGGAERYASATWAERSRIWRAHEDYQRGLLYYLQTDERLPEWLHHEMAQWGLAKDEFTDSGGWPTQLYVREARRMVGSYLIDQKHCEHPVAREDSIGLGSYSLDSHICQRQVKNGLVVNEGGFYARDIGKPYPIPYPAITPRADECENLLVTFCLSATHVAFASVRMEPPFMIMSESAAFAADQAMTEGKSVQEINVKKLISRLIDAGQFL
jgi:hypothetical protein